MKICRVIQTELNKVAFKNVHVISDLPTKRIKALS